MAVRPSQSSVLGRSIIAYNTTAYAAPSESSESNGNLYIINLYMVMIFFRVLFFDILGRLGRTREYCGLFRDLASVRPRTILGRHSDGVAIAAPRVYISCMTTPTVRDRSPKTRARRLRLHPLCVECLKAGITQPTEEIDHIIPLELGGPEEDSNTQGLCLSLIHI